MNVWSWVGIIAGVVIVGWMIWQEREKAKRKNEVGKDGSW